MARTVAGVDVGNHTTEIVLARVDGGAVSTVICGQAPTRGRKGGPDSLRGAAALLHKLEVQAGIRADEVLLSALRPVDTTTAPVPSAHPPDAPVRSLRRPGASTLENEPRYTPPSGLRAVNGSGGGPSNQRSP